MTDENFLSQDDIDALMTGLGTDDKGSVSKADSEETPITAESLQPAMSMILRQAATVVSTVLNRNADMSLKDLCMADTESVYGSQGQFKSDSLCVKVCFTSGIAGNIFLIITYKDTALLADLMMMGDGTAEYEEDHKDALSELENQIMGAVSTAMGTEFGISISCDQAETKIFKEGEVPFNVENCVQANVNLKIEEFEDTEINMIISSELAKSFHTHYAEVPTVSSENGGAEELVDASGSGELLNLDEDGNENTGAIYASTGNVNIDMLLDIPLNVTIELGRTRLSIRKILELGPGSIIELDRKASEPVDLLVSDKVVAKGEVVVVDEYFGIRIVSLISPEERIKHLK